METLALLIHLPSDRTSHMPWRAALISANAPQHSIEDTDSHIFTSATAQVLHHRNSEPGTVPQIARAVEARAEENRKPKK